MVDPEFMGELERLHRTYTGRPSIITEVPRFAAHAGDARIILKREDLNHTGSHKINNVLGPGPADQADGQDPRHRRDRRRPARRRHRHRRGPDGARVRHLHGQGRHRAAGPQRRPHADARRRGRRRPHRQRHPQGRHQRRPARLGHQRRQHPLHPRHGHRPAPVPRDGPRLPPGHRGRGARPGARPHRPPARRRDRLCRWRIQRDGHLPPVHRRRRRAADRHRGRGRGHRVRPARGPVRGQLAGRAARHLQLPHAGRRRPDPRVALHLGRASTTRASGPSTPTCATPAGPSTATPPTSRP